MRKTVSRKRKRIRFVMGIFLSFFFVFLIPLNSLAREGEDAYHSWVQKEGSYEAIYGSNGAITIPDLEESLTGGTKFDNALKTLTAWISPVQWISELIGGVFVLFGGIINGLLGGRIGSGEWVNVGHVDLTMDAVIFGRLLANHPINYVSWELRSGNIYGILSALLYRLFWNLAYSGFILVFFGHLIRELFHGGDPKKRAEFKDFLLHSALVFLLLYILPQIADGCIYLRDWLLKTVYFLLSGDASESSLSYTNVFLAQWFRLPYFTDAGDVGGVGGVAMGILFFASSVAGLTFAIEYIKVAVKQTALFAFFPVFALLSLKNKKLLSDWCCEFLPNLFIPVIDATLLLLPAMVIRWANTEGLVGLAGIWGYSSMNSDELDIGIFLIVILMIFSVIPMRKEILKLLGQTSPIGGSRGFGSILAAGMMAMRMFGRSGRMEGVSMVGNVSPASDNLARANALEQFGSSIPLSAIASENAESVSRAQDTVSKMATIKEEGMEGVDVIPKGNESAISMVTFGDEEGLGIQKEEDRLSSLAVGEIDGMKDEGDVFFDTHPLSKEPGIGDMDSAGFYEKYVYTPEREENLKAMDELSLRMQHAQSDMNTLSAENEYDASLLTRYENLSMEQKAKDRMGIFSDPTYNTVSGMDDELSIEQAMKERIASYQPKDKLAGKDRDIFNSDSRIRYPSGADDYDLKGRLKENITDRKSQIADLKKSYFDDKAAYEAAVNREAAFAELMKTFGSSGERFHSLQDYKMRQESDAILKKAATYQNFDAKGIMEHLTPSERARFYRERANKQMQIERYEKKRKINGAIMAGSGAVIGASAGLYGGEQSTFSTSIMGAMAGAKMTSSIGGSNLAERNTEQERRRYTSPISYTKVRKYPRSVQLGTVFYQKPIGNTPKYQGVLPVIEKPSDDATKSIKEAMEKKKAMMITRIKRGRALVEEKEQKSKETQ